jgi:ornithine cyclodeaminase/alanine dehydrogenase-like protein (mu-crystallin family)
VPALRFYPADEVEAALDYPALIAALCQAFRAGASAPLRHVHRVNAKEDGRLLLMPAWREGSEIGVKLVTVFPRNSGRALSTVASLYVVFDGADGRPLALLAGEPLTLRRTAATSALASTFLSRSDSRTLLVVGTGRLAPHMAAAHTSVRKFERVLVWGRSDEGARGIAESLALRGLPARPATDLASAAAEADVITCATTARAPVLRGAWIRPGTHVDLVGAFTPDMRESDDALVSGGEIFVDTYAGALSEAGDLVQAMRSGAISRASVRADLAELVSGRHPGRTSDVAVTVFKSVGAAIEDLCAATLVVARSARPGSGRDLS